MLTNCCCFTFRQWTAGQKNMLEYSKAQMYMMIRELMIFAILQSFFFSSCLSSFKTVKFSYVLMLDTSKYHLDFFFLVSAHHKTTLLHEMVGYVCAIFSSRCNNTHYSKSPYFVQKSKMKSKTFLMNFWVSNSTFWAWKKLSKMLIRMT